MNITLNLDNAEFDEYYEDTELWQPQAAKTLCKNLKKLTLQARAYREKRKCELQKKPAQSHDAIFISGERGAGKTVFLKNLEIIWKKQPNNADVKIHFCPTIDPTLLIDHDNFTNVIVAHLFNEVESNWNSHKDALQSQFYSELKKLADSLGQEGEYQDRIGIDRIIKYSSGIQVERLFHDFVSTCVRMLEVESIVIPIDDVDMALDKAFEVLDVVRRMLGCPFIIPIVSGDENLYQHMVKQHFLKDTYNIKTSSIHNEEFQDGITLADKLKESYLIKVFPNQFRISLLPSDRLLQQLEIIEKEAPISFKEYENHLYHTFFGLTNSEEKSRDYPKPSNAREITQLIRLLPPSKMNEQATWEEWESFRIWAKTKMHGVTFTNSIAAQTVIEAKETIDYRLSKLLPFDPKAQALLGYSWAQKDFYSEQIKAIEELTEKEASITNEFILRGAINGKVLRSMPPLEMHTRRMTISESKLKDEFQNKSGLYFIYTFKDYYGQQGNQINKVFFSRAFEILATSLIALTSKKPLYQDLLKQIISSPPFYCIHAMNPTKYITNNERSESNLGTEDTNSRDGNSVEIFIEKFNIELNEWTNNYKEALSALRGDSLIPLLHSVFNKVFTQLHLLKISHKELKDEHLSDSIRRFEYITINAFASFLSVDGTVKSNVASGATVDTIRDHSKFISREHVFTRNVKAFVDLKTGVALDDGINGDLPSKLIEAIWFHPVFLLNFPRTNVLKPLVPFQEQSITKEKTTDHKINNTGKKLTKFSGYLKSIKISNATEYLKDINKISDEDRATHKKILEAELAEKKIQVVELNNTLQKICKSLGIK